MSMAILTDSFIVIQLQKRFHEFLISQTNPPPLLYFLMFAYLQLLFQNTKDTFEPLLFLLPYVAIMTFNFNFCFTIAPFINSHPGIAVPTLAISLFFCNEKWKVYLFVFAVGDKIFSQPAHQYFMTFFSFFICTQIIRTLIFRNISDNVQYFVGMAVVFTYNCLKIFQFKFNIVVLIILLIVMASLAHAFIHYRVELLMKTDPDQIYSDRLMAHYLWMMNEQYKSSFSLRTKAHFHTTNCRRVCCFCKSRYFCSNTEYFMRQLYENALEKFSESSGPLLYEYYVQFLLRNEQTINALHFLSKWQPNGYLSYVGRQRARARVESLLLDLNSSNIYELQYKFALEYDRHYQHMAQQINSILKMKLQFWREINRKNPKVAKMQSLGSKIVSQMYDLNLFYSNIIKTYEKSIYLFDATALYAMYMLSTTNFKEYAEQMIKNTAKLQEEVYLFQKTTSQTFAIHTVVRSGKFSIISESSGLVKPLQDNSMSTQLSFMQAYDNSCKLIIESVSSGLCQKISIRRSELIGQELHNMIPDGYKEVHNVRLSYLLDFQNDSLKEIVPSKVMHKELKLPIKGTDGQLMMVFIYIKFHVNLKEGLTFVSVVKMAHDRSQTALMDFSGRLTECENGFNKDIIEHSEIQRYLHRLRQTWLQNKIIPEEKFSIMFNAINYGITISSPLLGLFLEKENLKQKCPPIHLEIVNQQNTYSRAAKADHNNKIGKQIMQMQQAIQTYDTQSSVKGSKGSTSAISIITTFSEVNHAPLYCLLQLVFLVTLISCILSNLGAYFITQLPWDSTTPQRNPLNDTMNFNALEMLSIKSMISLSNQITYYQDTNTLNKTRISQYFGFTNYSESVINYISKIESAFRDSIFNILGSHSSILEPAITGRFSKSLNIMNSYRPSQSQNLTYFELLMVYASDLNLMELRKLDSPIIYSTYSTPISQVKNSSFLSPIIDAAVVNTQNFSITVHAILIVALFLMIIPSYLLLNRRFSLHQKIFDLLVSIDAEQVQREVQNLAHISNILLNSKESNQIIKMNVLDYEENAIHPEIFRRNSADNGMVQGLEKFQLNKIKNDGFQQRQSNGKIIRSGNLIHLITKGYQIVQQQRCVNQRKRSGELDLTDSILDPSTKAHKNHCVFYLICLSFMITLGLSLYFHFKFNSSYIQGKNQLFATYNDQILFERNILSSKIILTLGPTFVSKYLGIPSPQAYIVPIISKIPLYNYYDKMQIYSEVISNCSTSSPVGASFLNKYCQLDYSEVILKGEFGALFKGLIQLRYNIDANLSYASNVTAIKQNITQKIFYLESLNIQLEELVLKKVDLQFENLLQLGKDYRKTKLLLLIVSIIWGITCFIVGLKLVIRMKKEYFQEIFMITFLNNDMILKNKRVQSFLSLISKNTFS